MDKREFRIWSFQCSSSSFKHSKGMRPSCSLTFKHSKGMRPSFSSNSISLGKVLKSKSILSNSLHLVHNKQTNTSTKDIYTIIYLSGQKANGININMCSNEQRKKQMNNMYKNDKLHKCKVQELNVDG